MAIILILCVAGLVITGLTCTTVSMAESILAEAKKAHEILMLGFAEVYCVLAYFGFCSLTGTERNGWILAGVIAAGVCVGYLSKTFYAEAK